MALAAPISLIRAKKITKATAEQTTPRITIAIQLSSAGPAAISAGSCVSAGIK